MNKEIRPRLFIDLDGVLIDWVGPVLKLFDSKLTADQVDNVKVHEVLGITNSALWNRINLAGESFWTSMPKYPWADEIVKTASDVDANFAFLTSPGISPVAASAKLKWLDCYYPKHMHRFILTGLKETVAAPGRMLVDDSESYELGWVEAGGDFVLFPRPWNRKRDVQGHETIVRYVSNQIISRFER